MAQLVKNKDRSQRDSLYEIKTSHNDTASTKYWKVTTTQPQQTNVRSQRHNLYKIMEVTTAQPVQKYGKLQRHSLYKTKASHNGTASTK